MREEVRSDRTADPSPRPSPLSTGAREERRTSNIQHPTSNDSSPQRSSEGVLAQRISTIEGVGPSKVKEFEGRGVRTLGDLLEYFPRTYQQERAERPIDQLVGDQIQIARGEVVAVDYIPMRPRPRFEATLSDGSGKLALVWFNSSFLRKSIWPGKLLRVSGRGEIFLGGLSMGQPKGVGGG